MRPILAAVSALVLGACGDSSPELPGTDIGLPSAELPDANDAMGTAQTDIPIYNEEVWFARDAWPGEYPAGFSVIEEGVTVMVRAGMHDRLPKDIACPLPQNATYQHWNTDRVEADKLRFVSLSERFDISITENGDIFTASDSSSDEILNVKAGDEITYLYYIAEGWAMIEHNGTEYEIEEGSLSEISNIQEAANGVMDEMLWLELPCGDVRGWLLYSEVLQEPGIVITPITGFGEARDLTEEDRQAVALVEASGD